MLKRIPRHSPFHLKEPRMEEELRLEVWHICMVNRKVLYALLMHV